MEYLAVLLPSIGVFLIFAFVYRAVTKADKSEREAYRKAVEEYKEGHFSKEAVENSSQGTHRP